MAPRGRALRRLFPRRLGSANGNRTRISALRGPRANRYTIAPQKKKHQHPSRMLRLLKVVKQLLHQGKKLPLASDLCGRTFGVSGSSRAGPGGRSTHGGGQDSVELASAEESQTARVAPIRRITQPAFQRQQTPLLDALSRNVLKVEVSAPRAVGISNKRKRDTPGIESPVARVASPRLQSNQCANGIEHGVPMGSETICATALGTNHLFNFTLDHCAAAYPKRSEGARRENAGVEPFAV